MLGLMQNRPLLISNLVDYVGKFHADREIVSRDPEGVIHRSNWGEIAARAKRVADALASLGVKQGDRIATLAWNSGTTMRIVSREVSARASAPLAAKPCNNVDRWL